MILPYDNARCIGVPGANACLHCRRREPGRPVYQQMVSPAVQESGFCINRISPPSKFRADTKPERIVL